MTAVKNYGIHQLVLAPSNQTVNKKNNFAEQNLSFYHSFRPEFSCTYTVRLINQQGNIPRLENRQYFHEIECFEFGARILTSLSAAIT